MSTAYTYKTNGSNQTGRIDSVSYNKTIGGVTSQLYPTLSYDYDSNGNITKVYEGGTEKIRYHYDELNRLVREDNRYFYSSYVYTYDVNGDILRKERYIYTTLPDIPADSIVYDTEYEYTDSDWKNGVTQFGNDTISYDANGNPTTYRGYTMTWDKGCQLASANKSGITTSYKYDYNGIRTEKTVDGVKTEYFYVGSTLMSQKSGNNVMNFYYNADGSPYGFTLNGTPYYYILNLQGDVIGIYNGNGTVIVSYVYNSWGKLLSITGTGYYIGLNNPLRYRGYVYDTETELYYLQSRYYDPETGRFISVDAYLVAGDPSLAADDVVGAYMKSEGKKTRIVLILRDQVDGFDADPQNGGPVTRGIGAFGNMKRAFDDMGAEIVSGKDTASITYTNAVILVDVDNTTGKIVFGSWKFRATIRVTDAVMQMGNSSVDFKIMEAAIDYRIIY